jgi:hypothetical protein
MKKTYRFTLLFATFLIFKFNNIKAQISVNDSLALVDLYDSTDGAHWTNHTNWLTAAPLSSWYGVTVRGEGNGSNYKKYVIELDLNNNSLNGTLPSSIGNFSLYFGALHLSSNKLYGSIPAELGNLKATYGLLIDLSYNQLSGSIPSNIGSIQFLSIGLWIYLNNNELTGAIPSTFGSSYITELNLSNNQLTGSIPSQLVNAYMGTINISDNQLSGTLPSFSHVLNFIANHNQLTGALPSGIYSLAFADLSYNYFNGTLPAVTTSHSIEHLDLRHNQLTGEIPSSIGDNQYFAYLDLSRNNFSGSIPHTLGNLTLLRVLFLNNNRLNRKIPITLTHLHNLYILNLTSDRFTFNGMEALAKTFSFANYANQKDILQLHLNGSNFSVSAGGTLSNNTYKWYKDGSLVSTIHGDSTFTPTANGVYYAEVTNSIATALTLTSDTIDYTSSPGIQQDAIAAALNTKNNFSVYPNPAKNIVHLYFNSNATDAVINVYDINGKKLSTQKTALQKNNSISVNIASLTAGTYFIETVTDEKTVKQKFVKQ